MHMYIHIYMETRRNGCVCVCVRAHVRAHAQSGLIPCDRMDCVILCIADPARLLCPWNILGKNIPGKTQT